MQSLIQKAKKSVMFYLRKTYLFRFYKLGIALLANILYGFPSRNIKCIGVTGTDGKTTTNELIYHIIKKAGQKVGIMSTISLDIGSGKGANTSKNKLTTLTHFAFNKYMQQAKKNDLEYMIVEPSSHAIYQYRFWPSKFIATGITNLTHEHLDFHGTMHHYLKTKLEMFYKWLRNKSIGVYPYNFKYKKELKHKSDVDKLVSFSSDGDTSADIYATNIQENPEIMANIHIAFIKEPTEFFIKTKLLGRFNMDNILIAIAICKHLGLSNHQIIKGVESFSPLPGRVQTIKTENNITIIIDFALTPHALQQLYESFNKLSYTKQIAVFGATGNRDKAKRPIMGQIATKLNDYVIITEDENYDEDGLHIMEEIEKGIDTQHYNNYVLIQDRKKAIKKAIQKADSGTVILITGMGNFETRKMGKKQIPWNDHKVVLEILEELNIDLNDE